MKYWRKKEYLKHKMTLFISYNKMVYLYESDLYIWACCNSRALILSSFRRASLICAGMASSSSKSSLFIRLICLNFLVLALSNQNESFTSMSSFFKSDLLTLLRSVGSLRFNSDMPISFLFYYQYIFQTI